ncbi:MAG: endonuclease MutS2 [Oscillospiraceae bacterium]|nr:endonuclease MutS2 [Oscillospiraceae bacterium]
MTKHHKTLELDKVLALLADHAGSAATRTIALELRPAQSVRQAGALLALTVEAHRLCGRQGTPSIVLPDMRDPLKRVELGAALSLRELLDIARLLSTGRGLQTWKKRSGGEAKDCANPLDSLFKLLYADKGLEEDLTGAILSEEEVHDRASGELYDIRRKIRTAHSKARDILDKIIRSSTHQKHLQEQLVTMRSGRFVVPVRAEFRGEIKGLTHDTSASGATVFVEPMSVVEQNNLIRDLEAAERREIARILLEFSQRVGAVSRELEGSYDALIELDLIFAKTRLADSMKASEPILVSEGGTHLKKARHPLIPADKIVPIDIWLGDEFDTLVITGPNTGGKTVALKTLGLLTLMAGCGLLLPVTEESRVRYYESVLADIGDEQSIEQSLSTFSGHMTNIVSILGQAGRDSLVLMDELGAGTDPVEGAALAVAIIDHLRGVGAKTAATTHYAEIKMYALQTPGVENASCEFDVNTLRPTYRLLIGTPGRSNAFAISGRLGLPEHIIEAAKAGVSRENTRFEELVQSLESTRNALESEREQAEQIRRQAEQARQRAEKALEETEKQKESALNSAREQAKSLVEQVRFDSGRLLDELDALKKQKDKADFAANVADIRTTFKSYLTDLENSADPVREKPRDENYRLPRPLKSGDVVTLVEFGSQGIVITPADVGGFVQVQAGALKTKVHQDNLRLVEAPKATLSGGSVSIKQVVGSVKAQASSSVSLRGMRFEEAMLELERFLDNAVLSGLPSVTVIHGKGTGTLRDAVRKCLRAHKSVRSFRQGAYGEGEAGVTIAELK